MKLHEPIIADTLNELTFKVCSDLLESGDRIDSRNGLTYEKCDKELFLKKPQNRHLYLSGRTNNIFACFAEIFWIMAGSDKLDPLMNFFLQRAKNYSDDGITWRAAYGQRLYDHNALQSAVQSFLTDGKNTRQSVIAIHHPDKDTSSSIKRVYDLEMTKDKPCNNFIWLWIRDNRLNMKVGIRSNDVIFGLSAINVPEWTFLQEIVLNILKNEDNDTFRDVQLGYYHHSVISLHVYDETVVQAQELIENKEINIKRFAESPNYNMRIGKIGLIDIQRLFVDIYNSFCDQISEDVHYTSIDTVFSEWNITKKENQLYNYAKLVEGYILNKLKKNSVLDLNILSPDLKQAVLHNKFTPKSWL